MIKINYKPKLLQNLNYYIYHLVIVGRALKTFDSPESSHYDSIADFVP